MNPLGFCILFIDYSQKNKEYREGTPYFFGEADGCEQPRRKAYDLRTRALLRFSKSVGFRPRRILLRSPVIYKSVQIQSTTCNFGAIRRPFYLPPGALLPLFFIPILGRSHARMLFEEG